MNNLVKIPLAYQAIMDDIGWFTGADDRHRGMPSRSGMTRNHVAEDYKVVNEVGKRINQKICCALVIGEWDKNNRLTGRPHMTPNPEAWDCASVINMPEAERCFEAIEESDYIDIAHHGILHSFWDDELGHDDRQYYIRARKSYTRPGPRYAVPVEVDYFKKCLEAYDEIYNDWGFTKPVDTFISPGFVSLSAEDNKEIIHAISEHGFKYWTNSWAGTDFDCEIVDAVTFLKKRKETIPWNAYDVNPDALPPYSEEEGTIFRCHWPNMLRYDPMQNLEKVDAWANFFHRRSEVFGIIISESIQFAAHQAQYNRFTDMTFTENEIILDFSKVDTCGAKDIGNTVYISMRNNIRPKACTGGHLSLYQTKQIFRTYKLEREGNIAKIRIK